MLDLRGEKEPRDLVWDFALRSRLACIYYQDQSRIWLRTDLILRCAIALASSTTLVSLLRDNWSEAAPWLAAAAAVASVVHGTARVPEKVGQLRVLLSQYTALTQRFSMMFQFGFSEAELREAIDAYHAAEQLEVKDHPSPTRSKRAKAQKELEIEIGARPVEA